MAEKKAAKEAPDMTLAEKAAQAEGEELAAKLQAEQEARPDDHELVVAAEAYNDAAAAAEENPPVAVEEAEAE